MLVEICFFQIFHMFIHNLDTDFLFGKTWFKYDLHFQLPCFSSVVIYLWLQATGLNYSFSELFRLCSVRYRKQHNCHLAPWYLKSNKLFLTLIHRYRNPERGFKPGTSTWIWDSALDHSATTASTELFYTHHFFASYFPSFFAIFWYLGRLYFFS